MTTLTRTGRRSLDRGIYLSAGIVVCALVITGFWPSYFSKIFSFPSAPLTALVHVHAALMTAWITLFVVQVSLVAAGRVDLHRRLGVIGFALLTLIVVVAVPTTIVATKLGGSHMPGPPLPGLALVAALFLEFVVLGFVGLAYRRRSDFHKRLMLLAAFAAMEAGVSRLPWGFLDSVVKIHVVNDLLPLAIIIIDTVRYRRLHPAFLWGFLFLISVQMLSAWIASTAWWLYAAQGIMSHL